MRRLVVMFAMGAWLARGLEPVPRPQPGLVQLEWDKLLSRQDLIYLSPPLEGWEGLPVGDGEAGAMFWNPPDRLLLQLNHSSLWDDVPAGSQPTPACGACREGRRGETRHAARLEIQPGVPLFDWKYLSDYLARLSLHGAEVALHAGGPLGAADLALFHSHRHHALVVDYRDRLAQPAPRRVLLERLGSRSFGSWANRLLQEPEIGLAETASGHRGNELWITKKLGSLDFAVAAWFVPRQAEFNLSAPNPYQCLAETGPVREAAFTLYLAVAHSEETADPLALARRRAGQAAAEGLEAVRIAHRADWAAQWSGAFLDLPQDRYWENLWWLADYSNIASRRGKQAPFFINSIWAWERDVQIWAGCYFHWNMWSPNFPLFAAGRLELLRPYFDWKKRQFPYAREFARRHHQLEGAFFTDYATRRGEQVLSNANAKYWPISGPLIAQEFYQYWEYSQDDEFLKNEALPFLRETALFLMNYSEEGADGKLHLRPTVPYEFHGPYQFRDCITEQAMIRWLLPALIRAEQAAGSVTALSARARAFLERLAPIESGPVRDEWLMEQAGRKVYGNPFFRGEAYSPQDRVFSTGWSTKHQRYVTHMDVGRDPESRYGVLCGAQVAPAWLAGLVGPDESPERRQATGRNSPEAVARWEMARNGLRTMRIFPNIRPNPDQRPIADRFLSWTGHNQDLPAFARLGLRDNLRTAMETYVEKYQITPQGFWNYWPWERWKDSTVWPTGSRSGRKLPFPEDPRALHISLEPSGIFPVTLMESLMTSFDGVIRLFPAYDRDAGFRLAAKGGFWVTARRVQGRVDFLQIESYAGKECIVSDPWLSGETTVVRLDTRQAVQPVRERDRLRFPTQKGGVYVLSPGGRLPASWLVTGEPRREPHLWKVKLHTEPYYHVEAPGGWKTKALGKARDF